MSSYSNMPLCDLRSLTIEAAKEIEQINNVACLILPKDGEPELMSALAGIETNNVAATVYLGINDEIIMRNGVSNITDGDFSGDGTTVMIINGICAAKRLSKETKGKIYMNGMMILPKALEEGCGLSFMMVNGMVKYMDCGQIQSFNTEVTIDAEMLSYTEPGSLLAAGTEMHIEPDVTGEMLKEKQIVLVAGTQIFCHKNSAAYIKATATAGVGIEILPDEQ